MLNCESDIGVRADRYDLVVKIALLLVSTATLLLLGWAAYRENFETEWRSGQLQYREILLKKAVSEKDRKSARSYPLELRQLFVPEIGAVDRCISCHTGFDDPRMKDQPHPFKTHPGDYLEVHEPDRFGCTVCHQGQGRATEVAAAHGRVPYWDRPLLEKRLLGSACGRCHDVMGLVAGREESDARGESSPREAGAEPGNEVPGSDLIRRGHLLFTTKGCLGCHLYRGSGATLGPDLTYIGDKTRHDFDFSQLDRDEPRTVEYWLEEHFLEPKRVSPGTSMPPIGAERKDATALTGFMLSLRRRSVLAPPPQVPRGAGPKPSDGKQLFDLYCVACHGPGGRGGIPNPNYIKDTVPNLITLAERLMLFESEDADLVVEKLQQGADLKTLLDDPPFPRFNVVLAQLDSVRGVIRNGNPAGKKDPSGPTPPLQMPAWGKHLSDAQIDSIIAYLLKQQAWEDEGEEEEEGK